MKYILIYSYKGNTEILGEFGSKEEAATQEEFLKKVYKSNGVYTIQEKGEKVESKENFALSQEELILISSALNVWLDTVTPYDYTWSDNPDEEFKKEQEKMAKLKEDIERAILPF